MMNLYYQGGSLFMGILTLLFLAAMAFAVFNTIKLLKGDSLTDFQLNAVKSIGLFAMVVGILGQLIGLFSAFEAIAEMGEVSQAMLAGGLKVSSITSLYGIFIFLIAYMIWFALGYWRSIQAK